ncbi:MAG: hypothetical protein ABR956_15740 [Terracidiphilus sp.]|jgi:hypothetical protein
MLKAIMAAVDALISLKMTGSGAESVGDSPSTGMLQPVSCAGCCAKPDRVKQARSGNHPTIYNYFNRTEKPGRPSCAVASSWGVASASMGLVRRWPHELKNIAILCQMG